MRVYVVGGPVYDYEAKAVCCDKGQATAMAENADLGCLECELIPPPGRTILILTSPREAKILSIAFAGMNVAGLMTEAEKLDLLGRLQEAEKASC